MMNVEPQIARMNADDTDMCRVNIAPCMVALSLPMILMLAGCGPGSPTGGSDATDSRTPVTVTQVRTGSIQNTVFAAPPRHPVTAELLDAARRSVERGDDAWHSGPGVFTATLPYAAERGEALLLPPGSWYPYHWRGRDKNRKQFRREDQPWATMVHHWEGSWLPPQ